MMFNWWISIRFVCIGSFVATFVAICLVPAAVSCAGFGYSVKTESLASEVNHVNLKLNLDQWWSVFVPVATCWATCCIYVTGCLKSWGFSKPDMESFEHVGISGDVFRCQVWSGFGVFWAKFYKTSRSWMIWMILCESTRPWALENCTPERGPWSLVTLSSGHLWPYYPRSLATLLSGHLRPYPFNNSHPPCVPPYNCLHSTSLFKLPPPAFHYTIVSILLLYLNFPPLRSTKPLSPLYFFI